RAFVGEGVWMLPSFERVPASIRALLERALALVPGDRFVDAEAFLRALAPFLAEHAPAFGTRDLAAILVELFGDEPSSTDEPHGEQTPATRVGDVIETYATRSLAAPPEPADPDASS